MRSTSSNISIFDDFSKYTIWIVIRDKKKMDKCISLLQSNYGCVLGNTYYSVTEKYNLLISVDLDTGKSIVMPNPIIKNKLDFIGIVNNKIYMVDMAGKWIAEAGIHGDTLNYYELENGLRSSDNFAYITVYEDKIYMVLRHEAAIYIFDVKDKTTNKVDLDIVLNGCILDVGVLNNNMIYVFSSGLKKCFTFSVESNMISNFYELSVNDRIMDALIDKNRIFFLSGDAVYDLFNSCKQMFTVEAGSQCSRICKCNDVFWIFPGRGKNIYKYRIGEKAPSKFINYPNGYEYEIQEGLWKFVGVAHNNEFYLWSMRSNNYFLKINKKTGEEVWMKPYIDNKFSFYYKILSGSQRVINEKDCDLKVYIEYVVSV